MSATIVAKSSAANMGNNIPRFLRWNKNSQSALWRLVPLPIPKESWDVVTCVKHLFAFQGRLHQLAQTCINLELRYTTHHCSCCNRVCAVEIQPETIARQPSSNATVCCGCPNTQHYLRKPPCSMSAASPILGLRPRLHNPSSRWVTPERQAAHTT